MPRIVLFTVEPNMNLNGLIKLSCDRITNIQCSVGTIVARRATHLESKAFGARHEVSRKKRQANLSEKILGTRLRDKLLSTLGSLSNYDDDVDDNFKKQ